MSGQDQMVVKLVNMLLKDALDKGAREIRLEASQAQFVVRHEINGELHDAMKPPLMLRDAICSRVKHMASLNPSEQNAPQDGSITIRIDGGADITFSVNACPTPVGERIVLRLVEPPPS